MTKWEYHSMPISFAAFPSSMYPTASEQLDVLGGAGWEMIQIVNSGGSNWLAIFKRPMQDVVADVPTIDIPVRHPEPADLLGYPQVSDEGVARALRELRDNVRERGPLKSAAAEPNRTPSLTERALITAREMLSSDKVTSLEQLRIAKLIILQRDCYISLGEFNYDRGHPSEPEWFGSWAQDLFATVDVEI